MFLFSMGSRVHARSKMLLTIIGATLLLSALDLATTLTRDASNRVQSKVTRWNMFAAADGSAERALPTKSVDQSLRITHIKGQERASAPFDLLDRDLAKKRAVKKRGANKKRSNSNRNNSERNRVNNGKKKTGRNSRGNGKKKTGHKRGGSTKKRNIYKQTNGRGSSILKIAARGKKQISTKRGKTNKAKAWKNGKISWHPKFDMTMCVSGGTPLAYIGPMYVSSSKQDCCRTHFPALVMECMLRSPDGNSAAGAWGGSAWAGAGAKPGINAWGGSGWAASGKSGKGGKAEYHSETTVLFILPGEATAMPTTYIPTEYPTSFPTPEIGFMSPEPTLAPSVVPTVSPTFSPTPLSSSEKPTTMEPTYGGNTTTPTAIPTVITEQPTNDCSNTRWYFWGAEDGIGGSIAGNQPVPDQKDEPVLDISAGSRYTLLVDSKGGAYASGFIESKFEYLGHFGVLSDLLEEGQNDWHQIDTVSDLSGKETSAPAFAQVYAGASATSNAGEQHSLWIDQQGNVYTSGNNDRGQLCLGDTEPRYIPNQVSLKGPAVAAAIGEDFTLILLDDGSVYGCGSNEKGELGLGNSVNSVDTPSNDNGLSNIVALSAGLNYALFHDGDGRVFTTGSNLFKQQCEDTLGEPTTTPKEITSLTKSVGSIMAGSESSYFLFTDATVGSCGRNDEGQLGDGTFIDQVRTSVIIPNSEPIIRLGSGPSSQSAFFIGEAIVYGAGANDRYQLGLDYPGAEPFPTIVDFQYPIFNIAKVSSSGTHTVSIDEIICTDFPTATPTTMPTASPSQTPTATPTLSPTILETCSWLYWGANEGRGKVLGTNQEVPELIDQDILDVTAGPRYTLLVDAEGYSYASGFIESKFEYLGHFGLQLDQVVEGPNQWLQIDTVVDLTGKEVNAPAFAQVYAGATGTANSGELHSLWIDQQGNVYTSGNNDRGQLCLGGTEPFVNLPNQVSLKGPAVAAAIGEDFTLILLDDGSVYGCGSNEKGELGLGNSVNSVDTPSNDNGLSNIIDLSAGLNHALFQAANGNVYGTGSNIYMQLCEFTDGEPVTTPKVITSLGDLSQKTLSIMAGRESSYFLLDNGAVKACGRNDEGQLGDGTYVDNEFVDVIIPNNEAITNLGSGPSSQSVFFFGENAVFGAGANDRFQIGIGEIGSQIFPVEVEFNELDTVAGILKISSSGTQTVAYYCPVEVETIASDYPTFSPTIGNVTSDIPTFSPTAMPTPGDILMTDMPTEGNMTTIVPTFSPTATPTYLNVTTAFPTPSPTYLQVATETPTYLEVITLPTVSPTYLKVISDVPTYLEVVDSPTFIPTETPTYLNALPTPSPTYLGTLLATVLYFSGDPASVGENVDGVLLVPTDANEIILDGSAGSRYTLLVLSDGSAAAGGIIDSADNYRGHLGTLDWVEGLNELQVITSYFDVTGNELSSPPIMTQVFAGVEGADCSCLIHSVFIDIDGNVYASGNNDNGQLCLGDTDSRLSPQQIDLPAPAVSAAVGADFTFILTADGKVYGCGSNLNGQLGLGPSVESTLLPDDGNGLSEVLSVSAGANFALFKTNSGLFVTGDNTYGQLCIDPSTSIVDTPSLLADVEGKSVKRFEAGYQSSYLLFGMDGSVAACGLNDVGQLGDGTTDSKSRTAVLIPNADPIINLGVGSSADSAFFLSEDNIYATGLNDVGQLGIDDTVTDVSTPTDVVFTESVLLYGISPGDSQTLFW